jgi:A/G-specific adenine glycosylase
VNGSKFPSALLDWYQKNARKLPWRTYSEPYAIWVSEIMLQQTRVETVIPYFQRWMTRFPTVIDLARASQQEVLGVWEGLGYYGRARNLHRAAQIILEKWSGQIPMDLEQLRQLPGIGAYTAGAIASIAFGLDTPTLDGNIRRVLARLFDIREPINNPSGEKLLWEIAESHLPEGLAGEYNQALMDLGATVCTPRQPDCSICPLRSMCLAYSGGFQEERPVRKARPPVPHHVVTAAVIHRPPHVLIAQRPADGLLGSLWEFPGGKLQRGEDLVACLKREICEELQVEIEVGGELGVYRHAYTHFRVTLHAFLCSLISDAQPRPVQVQDLRWVSLSELDSFPMGKIDRQISHTLQEAYLTC